MVESADQGVSAPEPFGFGRTASGSPYFWSTPMMKVRLVALLTEMRVRPMHKNEKLTDLVRWVLDELPAVAPDDPRTPEAVAIAREWWDHERRSK
jgi:hypothetical protein